MKLLVDAHLFDGPGQGTKTYLKGLYPPLMKQRPTDEFFFASQKPDALAREFLNLVNMRRLKYLSGNKFIRLAWDIPSQIRKYGIDFAHFQYISPLIKSCHEVVTIHDLLFIDYPQYFPSDYKLSRNYLFRRSSRRADAVTTVSMYSKEALVNHYGIPEEKIAVTPNGVLDLYWQHSPLPDIRSLYGVDQFILFVSRFEPRKNQAGLLKAYCDLKLWQKGIQLVFIGSAGIEAPEFDALYNSLDNLVRKNIFILTDINFEELKAFYSACLLFVYPSFAEGFGIPPLEAAVCGASVLCSNATAMKDFDFFGDQLFDPSQKSELHDKLLFFLDHPLSAQRREIIKASVKARYNWETSADIFSKQVLKS